MVLSYLVVNRGKSLLVFLFYVIFFTFLFDINIKYIQTTIVPWFLKIRRNTKLTGRGSTETILKRVFRERLMFLRPGLLSNDSKFRVKVTKGRHTGTKTRCQRSRFFTLTTIMSGVSQNTPKLFPRVHFVNLRQTVYY